MTNRPRRIFQIDGTDGGTLNIAEKPDETYVVLAISTEQGEATLKLSMEDFGELADLKYSLRYRVEPEAQAKPAKLVVATN